MRVKTVKPACAMCLDAFMTYLALYVMETGELPKMLVGGEEAIRGFVYRIQAKCCAGLLSKLDVQPLNSFAPTAWAFVGPKLLWVSSGC